MCRLAKEVDIQKSTGSHRYRTPYPKSLSSLMCNAASSSQELYLLIVYSLD